MDEAHNREQWKSRMGFILAAVGSAVGLGNIWRFPYLTAESGGASFVLLYLVLMLLIGIPVMIAEFVIGRGSQRSPVQALSLNRDHDWSVLGYLFVLTGFWILSYYSVVAGWTLRYMLDAVQGQLIAANLQSHFGTISSGWDAVGFHLLFMIITTMIVVGGVEQGIERTVKILIPLLAVLMVGLAIWGYFQPGSLAGYAFYLNPDPAKLFSLGLLADAAGQTFFTLSLGMGAMITYASYLDRDDDLVEETLIISFSNFSISFLAGLTVFPIIYSFGLQTEIQESTISTLFIAIPRAFQEIGGTGGSLLSLVFFSCLFLAALTSGISLLEVVTSSIIDQFQISRRVAATTSGIFIFVVGLAPCFSTELLGTMDSVSGNLLLLSGGFFLAVYVGWIMRESVAELKRGLTIPVASSWLWLIRYLVTPVLLALLLTGLYEFTMG